MSSHLSSFDDGPFTYLYYSDFSSIILDGEIVDGEYPDSLELFDLGGNYVSTLVWGHNLTHIAIGMTVLGSGWLGLGLGEVGVTMTGADIIMGYVKNDGGVVLEDMSSISQGKPTIDDDSYIVMNATGGLETQETTTIEFIIPLASEDTDGKDHNWQVGGTYGFFTAYHVAADNLGFGHTSHTGLHTVKVLPQSNIPPNKIDMALSVVPHDENGSVTVTILLTEETDSLDLSGIKIGIYEKSLFGKALLDIITTDAFGLVQKDIGVEVLDQITIISVLPAEVDSKRVEALDKIEFLNGQEEDDIVYDDLRDIFGSRMMRNIMLTLFLLLIVALIVSYIGVLLDMFAIFLEGKKEETK